MFEFAAPSPPRDVTVRLVTPRVAEVTWRTPAVTNGIISRYIVYAIPLGSTTQAVPLAVTTPQTIQTVSTIMASKTFACLLNASY